jgi:hypothetical protein
MSLKKIALTICLLMPVLAAFAQDDSIPLKSIIEKTAKFSANYPTEKVYLHFDKPYYAVGDTIWFKSYVTIYDHQPSALSKIVYVDLINSRDSIVQSLRLPVVNGMANGNITLPQLTFQEGNYHVRAYTNWMRNFDADYFFTKNITIGNLGDVTNPVNTHISFTNSLKSNTESITARLIFKDQDGVAFANKRVSWKVQNDDETIDKGKGVTDDKGIIDISFSSDKPSVFGSSDLITNLEVNYKKTITNTFSLKTASIPVDVQFFPEGGDMLSNVLSKVAFKAISSTGLGVDVRGTITDNDNNVVTDFTSQHLGMGEFSMVPQPGKTYKATVTFPDGTKNSYDLPRVLDEGINLTVNNNNPDTLFLRISSNPAFLQKFSNTKFYIIAQSGGVVYYAAQTALQSLVYTATILKNKFPTGILQISLLSSEADPLSERLVFIQHNDQLNVAVNTDRPAYTTRQRVRMNVSVKNNSLPVSGNFSLSVIDESKVPFDDDNETTILSSLLLTSDLKGYIEKPNYYFNHPDATKQANLDILMMTQGYRRFAYYDVVSDKNPTIYNLPEQGINISGTLRTNAGIPVNNGNLHLTIPDKIYATDVRSDPSGNFKFSNVVFQDSSQLIVTARNNYNGKNMMIILNTETAPGLIKNINSPNNVVNIDSTLAIYLQNSKKQYSTSHILKEVVIKAEPKKPSHADYPALTGLDMQPDHIINSNQFDGCNDLLMCLQTAAFGLTFDATQGEFFILRDYNQGQKTKHVQVYYNGMPVETSFLSTVDPKTVESVEIFLTDGVSGINKMNDTKGVLVVNGKKMPKGEKISYNDLQKLLPQQYELTISPMGYAKTRDFYVPKYIVPKSYTYSPPDLRTTIYWNPKVITDKATGKATVDFYNADGKGNYRVELEGLDDDGNIAHYVYHYKVN